MSAALTIATSVLPLVLRVAPLAPALTVGPTPGGDGGGGVCSLPGVSAVCGGVGDLAGGVAQSAAQGFVDGFADGFATLVKTMLTFWTDVPTRALGGKAAPVAELQGLVLWLQGVILVGSLLWVAARMALDRSGKAAGEGLRGLVWMIVLVGAGATGVDVLTVAGDRWAQWIMDQSTSGDLAARLAAVTGGAAALTGLGLGLEFVIALLGIISCLGQIFFLLARVGILTLLVGTLPLWAAGAATPAGKASLSRVLAWILAFVLYKPAAALVYAGAFVLTGDGEDLVSVLSGLMLILLAVLALPALMRLIVPLVSAASSGGGGALTGAVAGAVLASGARQFVTAGPSSSPASASPSGGSSGPGLATAGSSGSASPGASGSVPAASSAASAGGAGTGGAASGAAGGAALAGPVGLAVGAGARAVSATRSAANDAAGGGA